MEAASTKIRYLDGPRLRRGLIAGARRVREHHKHLNDINVFPVPDGDTGSNMAGTMDSIAEASEANTDKDIGQLTDAVAQSALVGARGNSGAILAQFFCGLSESLKGVKRIDPKEFADAAAHAAERAQGAMSQPKDGTILSVIRDWAEHLKENSYRYDDFLQMLKDSKERAHTSLLGTKEKLAALKNANVVDAGGQGFVYLLEGIIDFTERGKIRALALRNKISPEAGKIDALENEFTAQHAAAHAELEELTFPYCTEALISGTGLDAELFRTLLSEIGDSVVVAGGDNLMRLHVHTDRPSAVFDLALQHGQLRHGKVENMAEQHARLQAEKATRSALTEVEAQPLIVKDTPVEAASTKQLVSIVTDTTCDLPPDFIEEMGITMVHLRSTIDDQEYVDKRDISAEEFNQRLQSAKTYSSSQAPPGEFLEAFQSALQKSDQVLSIHLMEIYSGTLQAAQAMSRHPAVEGLVHTLNSKSLTGGLGLIVAQAARRARAGMSLPDIVALAQKDIANTRVFVAMHSLDFPVRGGRMSKGMGLLANAFQLKPVLEFASRHEGRVDVVAKPIGRVRCEARTLEMAAEQAASMRNVRFAITHVAAEETALRFAEAIQKRFGSPPEFILPAAASVGIHSGPGACAINMIGETD